MAVRYAVGLWLLVLSALTADLRQVPSDSATVRTRFNGMRAWERTLEHAKRASWQMPEAVVDSLALLPGQRVADIGAGTGYFNRLFARAVGTTGRVFAEEIEPELVEHMRLRAKWEGTPQVVPILGSPADPCLPDSLDLIFLCNTYRYIDGRRGFFARLRDNLVSNGRLVIVEFRRSPADTTERRILPEQVTEELNAVGYDLIREYDFLPQQYVHVYRVREVVDRTPEPREP